VIDLREEQGANASDSVWINSESISNEIDEKESRCEKPDEQRV
jgi:hypothetical protein